MPPRTSLSAFPDPHPPVLIAGAGAAGLTAAVTLARQGVDCLVVERRPDVSALPRATVISVRNMELLRCWGLADAVLDGGNDVEWRMLVTSTLAEASAGESVDVGYPTKEQSRAISPMAPACVPQDHLESVLLDHLRTMPHARVERGVAVEEVRQGPDGCLVGLRDMATGARRTVAARYLLGADGAHSLVRDQIGVAFRGEVDHPVDATPPALVAVFRAPLWPIVGDHRHGIYAITDPVGEGTLLPAGRDDRWIFGFEWDPLVERLEDHPASRIAERVRAAVGRPDLAVDVERIGSFTFAGAMADRFRDGSVFLIGDAAHQVTPRGGTGMNTAIADGFDLGWKLAWVLKGWAPAGLLDTYEAERRPVARHNLARSLDPSGSRREPLTELNVDLGGRIRHLWLRRAEENDPISTLDLVGDGLTAITGPWDGARTRPAPPYAEAPLTTHAVDSLIARGLGIGPERSLIVRPDGVPIEVWNEPARDPHAGSLDGAQPHDGAPQVSVAPDLVSTQ